MTVEMFLKSFTNKILHASQCTLALLHSTSEVYIKRTTAMYLEEEWQLHPASPSAKKIVIFSLVLIKRIQLYGLQSHCPEIHANCFSVLINSEFLNLGISLPIRLIGRCDTSLYLALILCIVISHVV